MTVRAATDLREARLLLRRYGVRHLPVTRVGRLVGIVSDRDVGLDHATLDGLDDRQLVTLVRGQRSVGEAMSTSVQVIAPGAPVAAAARLMLSWRISALPVVDSSLSRRSCSFRSGAWRSCEHPVEAQDPQRCHRRPAAPLQSAAWASPLGAACCSAYGLVMSWPTYGSFLVFAAVLVVVPGPDFAVVTRNTLASGRRRGWWSAVGVASSNAVQGAAASAGLGTVIVRSQPLFQAIRWAGVAYLMFLGVQAFRSAVAGRYAPLEGAGPAPAGQALTGWRQGFLSNVTNPKVLVFYLAVLPQFLGRQAPLGVLLVFALSHALLSLLYLLALVAGLHRARWVLSRRRVRRTLDATTGATLLGFSARLATEQT